jgi:hypothetical protein
MPPDSPEWQFYAVVAPFLNAGEAQAAAFAKEREHFFKQLDCRGGSRLNASRWRWPLIVAGVAIACVLMSAISFSAAVAQYSADAIRCATLSRAPLQPVLHSPWIGAALATVAAWPSLPFIVALFLALIVIAVLGYRKSGPSSRRVWP